MNIFGHINNSLKKQIFLGAAILLIPLFLLAGVGYYFYQSSLLSFQTTINYKFSQMMSIIQLKSEISTVVIPVNDYVMFNYPDEEKNYRLLSEKIASRLIELETLFAEENASQSQVYVSVLRAVNKEWENLDNLAHAIFRAKDDNTVQKNRLLNEFNNRLYITINYMTNLHQLLHQNIQDIGTRLQAQQNIILMLIFFSVLMALAGAFSFILLFIRQVLKPIKILEAGTIEFGKGNLKKRITIDTENELGHLAQAFNIMADEMEKLATRDALTGLLNRRAFFRELETDLYRSMRYQRHSSLLFLDIDHFKTVNDNYGHQTGDRTLVEIARLLKKELRVPDRIARYGGEEIAILLPETDEVQAQTIAERLRKKIEQHEFSDPRGEPFHITTSIGIAIYPGDAASPENLVSCADQALYQAKNEGRNRVVLFGKDQVHEAEHH